MKTSYIIGCAITFAFLSLVSLFIVYFRIKSLSNGDQPKPFEKITFYTGYITNIILFILTILSIQIALYSYKVSQDSYSDAQKSGPLQQKTLEDTRKAIEQSVEILRRQQVSTDSSVIVLGLLNKSILKQISISDSQYQIQALDKEDKSSVERNKLSLTINKINSFLLDYGLSTLDSDARLTRGDWLKEAIGLFESELGNPLLIRDKEAFLHWKTAIRILQEQITAQSNEALEKTVVVNGSRAIRSYADAEKILTQEYKLAFEEVRKTNLYVLKKVVDQRYDLAKKIYKK